MGYSHRRTAHIGLTAAVLGGLLTAVPSSAASAESKTPGKQRVIVELADAAALQAAPGSPRNARAADVAAGRKALGGKQDALLARAKDAGITATSVRRHTLLLNAVAMTVETGDVAKLKKLPGVKSVLPDTRSKPLNADAQALTGVPKLWERTDAAGVRATGRGTTVAVIDTGVDYTHPDLGGCLGEGCKVVAGYDFHAGDADPMDEVDTWNPRGGGHGTHVAGTIAAKAAAEGGVTGAAPDATLLAYRALDQYGGWDSHIIAAIEAAADPANPHRADIINLSLGNGLDGLDPLGRAATAAADAGILVVASAGNTGPGAYTVNSPASARGVLAVGASTSGVRIPEVRTAGSGTKLDTYRGAVSANPPAEPVTAGVADIGRGSPEELDAAGDLSGKILLYAVAPGTNVAELSDDQRLYQEAERRGALAIIGGVSSGGNGGGGGGGIGIGARQPMPGAPLAKGEARLAAGPLASGDELRMDRLVVLGVDSYQGAELAALAGTDAKLTLSGRDSTDEVASFSSRGPDAALGLKPDLVAPGVEIRSTAPTAAFTTGTTRMSGTSMASPLVAGTAALLHQLHPERTAAQLGAALTGSAKHLAGVDTLTQGAGRLDAVAAADQALTAAPATVSMGLADLAEKRFTESATLTVTNSGSETLSGPVSVSGAGASVSPATVSLPAGASTQLRLTVTGERPDAARHFAGAVSVRPAAGHALTVPYLLDAAPLTVEATPDPTDGAAQLYVRTPTAYSEPPQLTVQPPKGPASTVGTQRTGDPHYFRADVAGTVPGFYRVTARSTTEAGVRQWGVGGFEVVGPNEAGRKWTPIGPNNTDGSVTLSPSDGDRAVVGVSGAPGAFTSTDRGKSWTQRTRTPFMGAGFSEPFIVVDPRNADRWWLAAGAQSWTVGGGGILRTDDNGRTFQRTGAPDTPYLALVSDAAAKVLVAQTYDGLLISRDGGASWAYEELGLPASVTSVSMGGDDLFVRSGKSIWAVRSLAGASPQPAEKVRTVTSSQIIWRFTGDDRLLALQVLGAGGGLHLSADGGRTWSVSRTDRGHVNVDSGAVYYDSSEAGVSELSRDAGRTWTRVVRPVDGTFSQDFDVWADGSYTTSALSAGIYRAAEGAEPVRIGVQGSDIPSLAVADGRLLAGSSRGMYATDLPAKSPEWGAGEHEGTQGADIPFMKAWAKDPRIVWRIHAEPFGSFLVQKSTDGGRTWQDRGRHEEPDLKAASLMVDPRDPEKVAIGFRAWNKAGVYTTVDGGARWRMHRHDDRFGAIEADPVDAGRIWLGGYGGLYYSDDFGATVKRAADEFAGEVTAIAFDGSRMLVGGRSLRYSTDGGRSFHDADEGGLRLSVSALLKAGGSWYAATTGSWLPGEVPLGARGVLRSTDGGKSWRSVSAGLQNTDVLSLAAAPDAGALYVGTRQGGVHRLTLED
ncbi:S8 family serine peptidase [Streptomyces polyrhachis]|uniref:S8 family serine peptidase n=1 Tax=Streptomyces polyrhachis TaxID=1282885 RepID=A0ABW2GCA8_9ACTN